MSAATLKIVVPVLTRGTASVIAADLASRAGFSESVVHRYLKFLADSGT